MFCGGLGEVCQSRCRTLTLGTIAFNPIMKREEFNVKHLGCSLILPLKQLDGILSVCLFFCSPTPTIRLNRLKILLDVQMGLGDKIPDRVSRETEKNTALKKLI